MLRIFNSKYKSPLYSCGCLRILPRIEAFVKAVWILGLRAWEITGRKPAGRNLLIVSVCADESKHVGGCPGQVVPSQVDPKMFSLLRRLNQGYGSRLHIHHQHVDTISISSTINYAFEFIRLKHALLSMICEHTYRNVESGWVVHLLKIGQTRNLGIVPLRCVQQPVSCLKLRFRRCNTAKYLLRDSAENRTNF